MFVTDWYYYMGFDSHSALLVCKMYVLPLWLWHYWFPFWAGLHLGTRIKWLFFCLDTSVQCIQNLGSLAEYIFSNSSYTSKKLSNCHQLTISSWLGTESDHFKIKFTYDACAKGTWLSFRLLRPTLLYSAKTMLPLHLLLNRISTALFIGSEPHPLDTMILQSLGNFTPFPGNSSNLMLTAP